MQEIIAEVKASLQNAHTLPRQNNKLNVFR